MRQVLQIMQALCSIAKDIQMAAAKNINNSTLRSENKLAHLEKPLIPLPLLVAPQVVRDAYQPLFNAQNKVACLMLARNKLNRNYSKWLKHYMLTNRRMKDKKKPQGAKGKDKGKTKLAYAPKPKIPLLPKRDNPAKDSIYHQCKEVYDTSYGTHICNTTYGLRRRKLEHGVLNLYLDNGMVQLLKLFFKGVRYARAEDEETLASRSTDVMVMALPVLNINHSAFRSMFKREKLAGTNFNDWFHLLKLVLIVEKKMFVIEQPISPTHAVNSTVHILAQWNAVYDAYTEVAYLMLESMTP
ncbi:hypothetical protein Tco_1031391 [Tanacetum coccineum]|uniref:Uncharacterized protein n=1 Tax=Tanacetum coccineum TaxID=301880 RepID=A0ABQ5GAD0_9ASTR